MVGERTRKAALFSMNNDELLERWPAAVTTASGLSYVVTQEGNGEQTPEKGELIKAHYVGRLLDGTVFDSSRERNEPFETPIGVGGVIKGWDEAFMEMTQGEQRTLIIPPSLAYGEAGFYDLIPPHSTLVFEVELLSF